MDFAKDRDVEGFLSLAHDRITAWPHIVPLPVGRDTLRDVRRTRVITDYQLSFHAIEVHGDAAFVYYTADINDP